jgi:lysophospholipase L1-like esterase
MVVTRRSFWRSFSVGIAAFLFLAITFQLSRTSADDSAPISTTKKTSKTKKKSKTRKASTTKRASTAKQTSTSKNTSPVRTTPRPHPQPKPMKPVPLTPIEPVPIEMGEGDPLGTFFQALSNLESPPADAPGPPVVRIIHFGDSHVASDYWAGVIRERLQARFGDAGPGFVLPGRPWQTIRYVEAKSLDGQGWRTDGLRVGENDGVVGLGGMSLESLREANPASALASFSQFEILAATSPGSDCLQVQVDDADYHDLASQMEPVIPPPEVPSALFPEPSSKSLGGGAADPPDPPAPVTSAQRRSKRRKATPPVPPWRPWPADSPLDLLELTNSAPLAAGPHRISIRSACGSNARLLGVELSNGSKGILYDTDGVNGARLADLEKPLPALRKALLRESHPALIIVSYGTNDIGSKGFTSSGYEENAFEILSKLKADAGDASILVTGPTDRGNSRRIRRPFIQAAQAALQPALRRAALRAGCAYWDQQAAMGGPGAMTRWVRAGLAAYDYVHLSGQGYQKLADMLYDRLMAEYSNFHKTVAGE